MSDQNSNRTPQSPEVQPTNVRDDLDQDMVTHQGTQAESETGSAGAGVSASDAHLGATDAEVTPIMPPMRGPANLVGSEASGDSRDDADDTGIDPVDEITPG
ncbi:MAG TPA: hypothetical protein VM536_15565 [Chloroflexia bacterium]|nr:hypothetical protein [Chloroflexia bacterium]